MDKQAKVKQKKSLLIIAWIAPIVALFISYDMLKEYFQAHGENIIIYTKDVKGLNVRKSHIEYRGVNIGDLKSIKPDPYDINRFIIKARIYEEYNYFIKKGAKFYIVEPAITLNKIENVGTVLTGNYIELIPATLDTHRLSNLAKQNIFTALEKKPLLNGKKISILSSNGNVSKGTKITYKGIKIGEIIDKKLKQSNTIDMEYDLLIYEKYIYLLDEEFYFYIQNPIEFDYSDKKISFEMAPIKDMLFGTIVLEKNPKLKGVSNDILYDSKSKLYYKKEEGSFITIQNDTIKKNQKIFYKGIEIGYVNNIDIKNNIKYAKAFIKKDYEKYLTTNTKFYKQSSLSGDISLDGIHFEVASFQEIVFGGIALQYNAGEKIKKNHIYSLFDSKKDIEKQNYEKNFFEITLSMTDIQNIKNTSKLFYKNVQIAKVKKIFLKNNTDPTVILSVANQYKELFGDDAKIYMEGIEVSLSKVKNLSLEVLGDKFVLIASNIKAKDHIKKHFFVDKLNPLPSLYKRGKRLIVKAKSAKDLSINTPILYKYIKIGNIEQINLNTRTNEVELHIFIDVKYSKYITDNTIFYLDKTIDAQFSLFDSKVEFGSLQTLFKGGINIDLLTDSKKDELKENNLNNKDKNGFFKLFERFEK